MIIYLPILKRTYIIAKVKQLGKKGRHWSIINITSNNPKFLKIMKNSKGIRV